MQAWLAADSLDVAMVMSTLEREKYATRGLAQILMCAMAVVQATLHAMTPSVAMDTSTRKQKKNAKVITIV
jgi:hypothetical protein